MATQWIDAAAFDDVPQGDVIGVVAGGHDIALYGVDGEVYATDNFCTHGHARLCEGFVDGHEIECPLHQGKFELTTGKAICAPVTEDIAVYPVKVEGGKILVELAD